MWDVTARWVSAVLYGDKKWYPAHPNKPFMSTPMSNQEFRAEMLRKIAVVNVKKVGGRRESDSIDIRMHSLNYGDLICRQIKLYNPDIIISGLNNQPNIKRIFKDLLDPWEKTSTFYFSRIPDWDATVIDSNHPGARGYFELRHTWLVQAFQEVFR